LRVLPEAQSMIDMTTPKNEITVASVSYSFGVRKVNEASKIAAVMANDNNTTNTRFLRKITFLVH